MTIEKMKKELSKTYAQIAQLQKRVGELEEQIRMSEDAHTMKMIKKLKISSEHLQLLNSLNEDEILRFLEQKEKESDYEKEVIH